MGRIGEVITRTWQLADKMKKLRGKLMEDMVLGFVSYLYNCIALRLDIKYLDILSHFYYILHTKLNFCT